MFRDAAPDIDQQLLTGEGQWIFTIKGEKYYLSSSKRHFPLSYFKSVMAPRKMRWLETRSTDFVHVGILTLNGYKYCESPWDVLGMHPWRIRQDLPVREN